MNSINVNKLIAEFMNFPTEYTAGRITDGLASKMYETWNDLMPVVEKIETTKWNIKNYQSSYDRIHNRTSATGEINVFYDDRDEFKGWTSHAGFSLGRDIIDLTDRFDTKFEATKKAVVEFIKWYKKQTS